MNKFGYQVLVGIKNKWYISNDEGSSWICKDRDIPSINSPILEGIATFDHIPKLSNHFNLRWLILNISAESKVGIAIGIQIISNKNMTINRFFITSDGGSNWTEAQIKIKPFWDSLLFRYFYCEWPISSIIHNTVIARNAIFFAFNYDNFEDLLPCHTYILSSDNLGKSWQFYKIEGGGSNKCILTSGNHGQIISPRSGFYMQINNNSDIWEKHCFKIRRDYKYSGSSIKINNNILDDIKFVDSHIGYSKVIHPSVNSVEILKTEDGGCSWKHLIDFNDFSSPIGYHHYCLKIQYFND